MKTNKEQDFIVIFSGSAVDAEIVKSILNDSEIETYLKDEYMGTIAPWQSSAGGVGAVKVVIANADYAKAKPIIDEYMSNLK